MESNMYNGMDNENNVESTVEFIPLGRRLKKIVETVKVGQELENLGNILIDLANRGNWSVQFTDMKKYVPTIAKSGNMQIINDWAIKNELMFSGKINELNGAWECTISWEE